MSRTAARTVGMSACATLRAGALAIALLLLPRATFGQRPDTVRAPVGDTTKAVRLGGIRVTGTRLSGGADERSAARVDVLSIRTPPPEPSAVASILVHQPGVTAFDDQGTRLQPTLDVRGFTASPVVGSAQGVSVFLDGVRVNEADAQELNFDLLPIDAIDRAELIRGPATLFGKNSLAGALMLSTDRGNRAPRFDASTEVGPYGYRAGHVIAAGASRGVDGYVLARASNEDGYREHTGARTRMLFGTVGHRGSESDAAISVLLAHNRLLQAGSLPESWLAADRRANYTEGDFFEPDLLAVTARGNRRLLETDVRGTLFVRRNNSEQFNVNVDNPSARALIGNRSYGGTAELSYLVRSGPLALTTTLGGELARSSVRYRIFQEPSGGAPIDVDCEPTTGLCEHASVEETDAAAFAQLALEAGDRLSVTASARGDAVRLPFRDLREPANDATNTFRRISPRLGVTYRFAEGISAYGSVGSGFRAPAPLELACADAEAPCPLPFALGEDPPLAPVTVWNYEAGLAWRPRAPLQLELTAFRSQVRDEIVFVSSQSAAGYFQNLPRTRRDGIELSGEAALPLGVRVFGSYSFIDATYQSDVQLASAIPDAAPVRPGDRFSLSPRHRGTAGIGLTRVLRAFSVDGELSARAVSSQFLRGDEANRYAPLPAYSAVDLRVGVEHESISATLHVTNLLDSRYVTFGVYGLNPLGPIGGPAPVTPPLERFLTPSYPRAVTVVLKAAL